MNMWDNLKKSEMSAGRIAQRSNHVDSLRKSRRKQFQRFGLFLAILALSACDPYSAQVVENLTNPVLKDAPEEKHFEELCQKYAGPHVYKTAENVKGVFDSLSDVGPRYVEFGLNSQFDFIEYRVTGKMSTTLFFYHYVDSPGLYRFTYEKPNHPNCGLFYKRWKGLKPKGFKNKCIATWRIDEVTARYRIDEDWSLVKSNDRVSQRHRTFSSVDGKKLYAEHYRFKYVPKSGPKNIVTGRTTGTRSCPASADKSKTEPRVDHIFVPAKLGHKAGETQ